MGRHVLIGCGVLAVVWAGAPVWVSRGFAQIAVVPTIATAPPSALRFDPGRLPLTGPVDPENAARTLGIPDDATADALFQIGAAYFRIRRMAEAAAYFWKGASVGDARSASALGTLYVSGVGVARQTEKGLFWLNKAAASGNRGAAFILGRVYERGIGVPPDPLRAVRFYEVSAKSGFAPAAKAMAVACEFGRGVPRDRGRAIVWMQQAAAEGDRDALVFVLALQSPQAPGAFSDERALIVFAGRLRAAQTTTARAASAAASRSAMAGATTPTPAPTTTTTTTRTGGRVAQAAAAPARSPSRRTATWSSPTGQRGSGGLSEAAARRALMQQSMGFGGIFGGMINSSLGPPTWNGGGGGVGGGGGGGEKSCDYYSDEAACSAHRNGDDWAADRLQNDPDKEASSERDWYDQ